MADVLIYDLAATAISRMMGGKSLSVILPEELLELPDVESGREDPGADTE